MIIPHYSTGKTVRQQAVSMSFKKKSAVFFLTVILLFGAGFGAEALWAPYVNDDSSTYDGLVIGAFAVGADGVDVITEHMVYALTAKGQVLLNAVDNTTENDDEVVGVGGGGLRYDNGSVRIFADRVRVGLRYYYNEYRDTSMEAANLENYIGRGYAFGYLDENERFVPFDEDAWTDETKITMRPIGEKGIGVYVTGTEDLLFAMENTGASQYLAVHPLSDGPDALTWFSGRRYYGDFAYAILGNDKVSVVNCVPLESYVQGVCAGEVGGGFPAEALKAQAVAARSYVMYHITLGDYQYSSGFDLTSDDWSQVYHGYTDSEAIRSAVAATENQYLTYNGRVISAMYSAADGGETLNSEDVFPSTLPYLRGVKDPYEAAAATDLRLNVAGSHRVGMSQCGAYAMAKYYGKTYKDILGFYYTNVGISYGYR